MEWVEYKDCYVIKREVIKHTNKRFVFDADGILPGVSAAFIIPRRKGGAYKLGEVVFDKKYFSFLDAQDFWSDFDLRCVEKNANMNRKFPSIEFAADYTMDKTPELIVFGCYRNISEYEPKEFLREQLNKMVSDKSQFD